MKIVVTGRSLSMKDVIDVAKNRASVVIATESKSNINKSRDYVLRLLREGKIVYGLTTGFGKFSDTFISAEDAKELQLNLIRSHACGVGQHLSADIVRATLLLRINSLALGFSGIRFESVETMIQMLNSDVIPVIPEKGSLGASGDLAPLAHLALVLIGEGEAFYKGKKMNGRLAMKKAGITPITLEAKEGLALINGTQVMTAIGVLACWEAMKLLKWADCIAALTMEALAGIRDAFDPITHLVRPHKGQLETVAVIRRMIKNSQLTTKQGEVRVQDAYSIRCIPQVHGASKDAVSYIIKGLDIEMNSATDNPLIFADDDLVISGGNFHGQPIALSMDFLSISMAELANISERRTERLVNPQLNHNLPPFLTLKGGKNSGFMIAQYAAAALVSENKSLSHPASVDSIPSSANQEDHVSMGTIAARKAYQIIENAYYVLAIEWICASQAIDFLDSEKLGDGSRWMYQKMREKVKFFQEDRVLSKEFVKVVEMMKDETLFAELEQTWFVNNEEEI